MRRIVIGTERLPWSILEIPMALPAYALVLFRISGLMLTAPIFGSTAIPLRVRSGLAIVMAAMIFPLVGRDVPVQASVPILVIGGIGELMIGISMGLALTIILTAATVSGRMVGQQAGIALGQVFDPTQNEQVTIVGQVYAIVMTLFFLLLGGHRAAISALLDTFGTIPLLSFQFTDSILLLLIEMLTSAFLLGLRLAGPVLVALFLTTVALGFLSRTIPQLNILSVGFTLRVIIALGAGSIGFTVYEDALVQNISEGLALVREAFALT